MAEGPCPGWLAGSSGLSVGRANPSLGVAPVQTWGAPARVPSVWPPSPALGHVRVCLSLSLFFFFSLSPRTCAITALHKRYPAWEFKKNPLWTVLGRSRPSSGETEAQDRAAALACNQVRARLSSSILFYVKPSGQPEDLRGNFLGSNLGAQLSDYSSFFFFFYFFF